ncbi:MAG: LacI family transcriptional regulator [Acidobacteriia bacterium]|nr:LacI family transcriptional regulator [Terriglobia bacterium]
MAVTMSDIARDLKVSVVTVSKVLRNQGRISVATRKRVLRRAKELHYQMNWVARSLVTRRTYTIGLLLPEFAHPFFAEIARAIAQTVRPHGYHVIISYFEEDPELEVSEADSLLARQVDGLIIASAQPVHCLDLFRRIQRRKVPFVLIDRPIAGVRASFVGVDNRAIGRLATEHLIARGCRRIGHLRGPAMGIATERFEGYRRALAKRGLSVSPRYVVAGGHEDDTGYEGMRQLLRVRPVADGVFCYSDPVAIGAIRAILEAGLKVPDDISVVGAGNVHYSDVLVVPLTTVDQGTCRIGVSAAELLIEGIASKRPLHPRKILIPPKLVERESTRR